MKTINIFGRKMPILAILMAALIVGTASAAVVSYLSNEGNAEVTVESPFTVEMSLGQDDNDDYGWADYSVEPLVLSDVSKYGGESSTYYIKYENLADTQIDMEIMSMILCNNGTNPLNVSTDDFRDDLANENQELNGITIMASLYNSSDEQIGGSSAIKGINEDFSSEDLRTLTLETFTSADVFGGDDGKFPAEHYAIIEVTLHHAPTAYGTYTISTQVFDPYMTD